ncbi:anthranilate synthase component II [Flavilitoribacter nigricans]|uniref:Aminodeoxychorismate/anthranilate synthase component II n=1 Tax=Flavilitoribacter nigricans (strain ATCC 23147 / DSM 23189 / NBRC 102662 / NCIMB 1420 / SS-2) TaxID=1122177 RepID=A0A2D0NJE2_FLAN2|nr:aminodeoxychorismate/anthranilate synthase component II [Flavilitoribacter nigricans]PHN08510.1 aminodeoxychorismate/anthranilate synthase component II [Flavilitoribacter nigricans DSM 23189 = NBRC 102662]
MKVLVLDNYDSFTYNLVQYIQEILGQSIDVYRNDEISLDAVDAYDVIILSPGPGLPSEAGIMPELIKRYAPTKQILGVCLGHQAIGEAFGGDLENLTNVFHGIETAVDIIVEDDLLFQGVDKHFQAGRYHSWVVSREGFPADLEITAVAENDVIMAMRHREHQVWGVQFHPESIMTAQGMKMLENFLEHAAKRQGTELARA